jgi:hypothetical protein
MLNMADDQYFPAEGVHRFFNAISGRNKRLMFWPGNQAPRVELGSVS